MSTVAGLPPTVRAKLADAARHLRFLRLVRGLSLLVAVLALAGGAALLADAVFELPAFVRLGLLAAWGLLAVAFAVFGLVLPQCRRLDPETLAAVVEEKYPDLGERLTSAVELAETTDQANGSPALIALLIEETETRTRRLDFSGAVPARHAWSFAAVAVTLLALVGAPAAVDPERFVGLGTRFLMPWQGAARGPAFALAVTPGDAVAARGRPLTFAAAVEPLRKDVALPTTATLVLTDTAGTVTRHRMVADCSDAFSFALAKVPGDFAYAVEAGGEASDSFQVRAVEPVELASESPTITVTPPKYAQGSVETQTVRGLADLAALQHSQVAFAFRFTRPAAGARLRWTARSERRDEAAETRILPLELSDDRLSARAGLPAVANGTYRVVLEAEEGVTTELDARSLTVQVDKPPAFLKVGGHEDLKAVLPYDRVPVDVHVADDIAVDKAEIEYRVNNGPPRAEPIALEGRGTREAKGHHLFALAGRVKEGDEIAYRIRAADNRRVPEAKLDPQVIYHPAEGWRRLKVANQAQPLREQEILAQRDSLSRKLEAIKADLEKEQRGLYKLKQESRGREALDKQQAKDLQALEKDNRGVEEALHDVAREAEQAPALQPLADRARDVADREVHDASQDLRGAETAKKADERSERLKKADAEVAAALARLEALRKENERAAQERLDQARLEMAAERQQNLAERAAELAAKDPVRDPSAKPDAEQLRREQADLANDLQRLADQSEAVKNALDAARAEQARKLGERAEDLAKAQRDVADARRATEQKRQDDKLGDLARRQQELAERAAKLAEETKSAAQAARAAPLKPEETRKATEALKRGDASEALKRQDQAARDLDQLAGNLDRAAELGRDPREAARQLARLQDTLQKRAAEEAKKTDAKTPLAQRLQEMRGEEEAIRKAAEGLSLPPRNAQAQQERAEATRQATKATEALRQGDAAQAQERLEKSRKALDRLADQLPTLAQRQQQARQEIAEIRKQQDEVTKQAEKALKAAEKDNAGTPEKKAEAARKLDEVARRQADVAERLGKMDAANEEARQKRALESLQKARADLKDAPPKDVGASQAEAKRQLERLSQALNGQKPVADPKAEAPKPGLPNRAQGEQARQLAKQQRELREATEKALGRPVEAAKPADEKTLAELKGAQQEIAKRANELAQGVGKEQGPKSEPGQQASQAAQSAKQTSDRLQAGALSQAKQSGQQSAEGLRQLARQMAQTPRGQNADPHAPDPVQQARDLAKRQEEVNRRLEPLAEDTALQRKQQQERQQQLRDEAGQLMQDLNRAARQMNRTPQAQQSAQQAANSSQQAQGSMQQAQEQDRQGNQSRTNQMQNQAAQALDQAARQALRAGQQMAAGKPENSGPQGQAGQSLQQAQGQMSQAQQQLGQGQAQGAQGSMQGAAQSLQQAAQAMAQGQPSRQPGKPGQPSKPGEAGADAGGLPDLSALNPELKKYAGKRWGDLPGELRTKVLQDMEARYGDDYARRIKLYFEQLAETRKK